MSFMTVYLFYMSPRTVHAIVELKLIAIIVLAANFYEDCIFALDRAAPRRVTNIPTVRLFSSRTVFIATHAIPSISRLSYKTCSGRWCSCSELSTGTGAESLIAVVAIVPLIGFPFGVNWLVIPKEEADLLQLHPINLFRFYAKLVHRWVGRRIA